MFCSPFCIIHIFFLIIVYSRFLFETIGWTILKHWTSKKQCGHSFLSDKNTKLNNILMTIFFFGKVFWMTWNWSWQDLSTFLMEISKKIPNFPKKNSICMAGTSWTPQRFPQCCPQHKMTICILLIFGKSLSISVIFAIVFRL